MSSLLLLLVVVGAGAIELHMSKSGDLANTKLEFKTVGNQVALLFLWI